MMSNVLVKVVAEDGRAEDLGLYATLEGAIADSRDLWGEDLTPLFICLDEPTGELLATLERDPDDPELCLTTYADGREDELHRCRYVLDDEGRYLRTEVVALDVVAAEAA